MPKETRTRYIIFFALLILLVVAGLNWGAIQEWMALKGVVLRQAAVTGILVGSVLSLVAMGLTLIWGVMNVINLSHGPIIALGMFGTFFLFIRMGINPYVGLIPVAALGLLLGILIYFVAVHRVINAPHLSSLLATFSVNMIIIGIGTAILTTSPYNVDFNMGGFQLGNTTVLGTRLIAALIAILVTGGLYLFLYRTRPGKFIRAVTNNRAAAELMGVPSTRILALSFGLGTMLAAVSGALIATFFPFNILSSTVYPPLKGNRVQS